MKTKISPFTLCLLAVMPFVTSALGQGADPSVGTVNVQPVGEVTNRVQQVPLSSENSAATSSAVGILVKDGKAYLMRGGQATLIESAMSMTVSPDGTITGFDGQTMTLPEGQMLTMDGRITAISANGGASMSGTPMANPATPAQAAMAEANSRAAATPMIMEPSDSGLRENNPRIDKTGMEKTTSEAMKDKATRGSSGGSSNSGGTGSGTR